MSGRVGWISLMTVLAFAGAAPIETWGAESTPAVLTPAVTPAATPALATIADSTAAKPAATDAAARRYLNACAGCHRLEGAKLNGPALPHVAAWPPEQLRAAIKRMEKNVGPLTDGDLDLLGDFLRAPDARPRLAAEEERVRAQFALKLAPPDRAAGQRLFHGAQPLSNGGMACVACHTVAGVGGRLGPDLTDAATRLGVTPLTSGIVSASYKVMAPHYQKHPVTPQEAAHITAYLAKLSPPGEAPTRPDLLALGTGGAAAAFLGLAFYYRRGRGERHGVARRKGA